jgi:hypothetical protein
LEANHTSAGCVNFGSGAGGQKEYGNRNWNQLFHQMSFHLSKTIIGVLGFEVQFFERRF